MRLDGAQGKKQVWRPHIRTGGLSEANVLHWSTCDIVRTFRRPGNCAPSPPSLRPWLLRSATRLNKSWYTALTTGIRELWDLGRENFSILPNFYATLRKTNRRVLQGDGSSEACPNISGSFSWILKIFSKSLPTSYAYSSNAETLAKD